MIAADSHRLAATLLRPELRASAAAPAPHDDRDHLEGGGLPTPVKKNSAMKQAKKPQKAPGASSPEEEDHPERRRDHAEEHQVVTRAPPCLSATQPVPARLSAPTSGPRKTNCSDVDVGNSILASSGKPAE